MSHTAFVIGRHLKTSHPDTIILVQLHPSSDWYEAFDDDARILDECCNIDSRTTINGLRASIPTFRVGNIVEQLLHAGHPVVVCEPK